MKLANNITSPLITTAKASVGSKKDGASITIEPDMIAQVSKIVCKILFAIFSTPFLLLCHHYWGDSQKESNINFLDMQKLHSSYDLTHTVLVVAESVCNFGIIPMQFDHTYDLFNFVVSAMQFDHTDSFGRLSVSCGRVKKILSQVKLFCESLHNCHTEERIKNESGNWNESGTVVFLPHPLQWKMTVPPPVEIRSNPLQWKLRFDIGCESVHTSSGNKEKVK